MTRPIALLLVGVLAMSCRVPSPTRAAKPAVLDVRAVDAGPAIATDPSLPAPAESCQIEGSGEPEDSVTFVPMRDLVLAVERQGAPIVKVDPRARRGLHMRFDEIAPEKGDGRLRIAVWKEGAARIGGYARLDATRFRVAHELAVVPDHVWLEPNTVVYLRGMRGPRLVVVADGPYAQPRELVATAACRDIDFEPLPELFSDRFAHRSTNGYITRLELYDRPGGKVVFAHETGLVFVESDRTSGDFVHVTGARNGVRYDGWTPASLVSRDARGSGGPSGGRSYARTSGLVRAKARTTRETRLLVRGAPGETPKAIGTVEPGVVVGVTPEAGVLSVVTLPDAVFSPVPPAELLVESADLGTP